MFLDFFYFLTLFHGVPPMKNARNLSGGRPPKIRGRPPGAGAGPGLRLWSPCKIHQYRGGGGTHRVGATAVAQLYCQPYL